MEHIGVLIIAAGVVLILVGVAVLTGALNWLGHLPGDIRIETGSTRLYIPITSTVIISVVLSLGFYLLQRLL